MENIEKIIQARGGKKQNNFGLRLVITSWENKHTPKKRGIHEQADCLPLTTLPVQSVQELPGYSFTW